MNALGDVIYARLEAARADQPTCNLKHPSARPYVEDLALVIQLAISAENRNERAQRALLRVAHRVDQELNQVTTGNPLMFDDWGNQVRGWSTLEKDATKTAHTKPVQLNLDGES